MLQMSQVYVHWWKTFVKCWLSTVAVHLLHYNYFSDERNLYSLEESNRISQNVEQFKEFWCRIRRARVDLNSILRPYMHVLTIFHGMDLLLDVRSKWMPAKVRFRSLTLDQQVSSVVSAFKQKLGMVNWSTLAATLGVCYCPKPSIKASKFSRAAW